MRGKSHIKRRLIEPDHRFHSVAVSKFINMLMLNGKKTVATRIVYLALEEASTKVKREPVDLLDQVIKTVSPVLEVRSRRVGGANYQVPVEVRPERRVTLAMRWIIQSARDKQGKPMEKFLADELIDAMNGTGSAMKKREDTHKMAEANRAFAHFARY